MPRVSVVVPTYNRAYLLRDTLPTLLAQTEQDLEIVIVDSASTDDTVELVERAQDPRLRLVRAEHSMPHMANWTRAIHAARGEYVALYHDDDLYEPHIVARSQAFLDAHPTVGMVHVGARLVTGEGRDLGLRQASGRDFVHPGRSEALRWIAEIHDVVASSTMTRRTVYEAVGGFEADLVCADWDMYVRMALVADIGFIAGPLLKVRLHRRSVTNMVRPWRWVEEIEILLPRFRSYCEAAVLQPPQGWATVEKRLRSRLARMLWRSELSLILQGAHALAAETRKATLALDSGVLSRLGGLALAGFNHPAGSYLLRRVRSLRP